MSVHKEIGTAFNLQAVDELICATLRDENLSWPGAHCTAFAERFLERSAYHGVQALLHERLHNKEGWPSKAQKGLHDRTVALAMWDLRHQQVLTQLIEALANSGVQPVIFKGSALAYSLYKNSALRTRGDTDLIILFHQRPKAHDVLISLGFELNPGVSGNFISYQASYMLKASDASSHLIDLHWRINNSELLSWLFSYDELARQAVPLSDLGPNAIAAGPVHALLLACMHRAVHRQSPYYVDGVAHYGGDRLIWLWDIHLLAHSFTPDQWQDLISISKKKGLCATTLEGLERAHACFDTRFPVMMRDALVKTGEPVALYMNASQLRRQWMDFFALDGLSSKLRFLQELVFPPAAYMRTKYSGAQPGWLPWLYARRALDGVVQRLSANREAP